MIGPWAAEERTLCVTEVATQEKTLHGTFLSLSPANKELDNC
jgi:hypothetical protein